MAAVSLLWWLQRPRPPVAPPAGPSAEADEGSFIASLTRAGFELERPGVLIARRGERVVRVAVTRRATGGAWVVRASVTATGVPDLVIEREWSRPRGAPDLETGSPEFDARYWLRATGEEARALGALRGGLAPVVERLFQRQRVGELRFGESEVVASAEGVRELDAAAWLLTLRELEQAAECCERVPITVPGLSKKCLAFRRGSTTRCPYCMSDVTPEDHALVACERCATVVHGACWNEHGRCPVFGCAGRVTERSSERS